MDQDFIIKRWGTPEQYFTELESFVKRHESADCRTMDAKGNLVGVTYYFRPYQVAKEHIDLMEALREANEGNHD